MANSLISLGSFTFQGFEAPDKIVLRGRQRISVHYLGSGQASIGVLGRDYQVLSFQGILSGSNAVHRARVLDQLRFDGDSILFRWESRNDSVIVRDLRFEYRSRFWISYSISCVVMEAAAPGDLAELDTILELGAISISEITQLLEDTAMTAAVPQIASL